MDTALDAVKARHEAAEIVRVAARQTQIQEFIEEHGESRKRGRPLPLQVRPFSKADILKFKQNHYQQKGNVTALSILPYFCGVTSAVINLMHCFSIGICKTYFIQALVNGKYLLEEQGAMVQDNTKTPVAKQRKIDHQVLKPQELDALHHLISDVRPY